MYVHILISNQWSHKNGKFVDACAKIAKYILLRAALWPCGLLRKGHYRRVEPLLARWYIWWCWIKTQKIIFMHQWPCPNTTQHIYHTWAERSFILHICTSTCIVWLNVQVNAIVRHHHHQLNSTHTMFASFLES